MSKSLSVIPDAHVDPYKEAIRTHEPAEGDYYADRNPGYNSRSLFRLAEKVKTKNGVCWKMETIFGPVAGRTISDYSLRSYYRPLVGDFEMTLLNARLIIDGKADQVAAKLLADQAQTPAETEALMTSGTKEQIVALLDESERRQNMLEEIRLTADIIIENKKAELDDKVRQMGEIVKTMMKKVDDLVKIITVLNLYTGKTVDIYPIIEGKTADPQEPLSLRQRILYMDEELCAELDHEADYADVPLFFDALKDPAFRDIVVPEERCVVAVKPKRHEMGYRSGDAFYDAARESWNKHTYIVLRNGENVWWLESDDLEVWGSAFPHSDFEETFRKQMADESTSFMSNIQKEHENVRYRTTKYMVFLQGLIDVNDFLAPMAVKPNLMKGEGVALIRDDENLIGTGRKSWQAFRDEKNALIRRGTRILYDGGKILRDGKTSWNAGGDHVRDYMNECARPQAPGAGVYHADVYEQVLRHEYGKAVTGPADFLVFRYMPGDTIWKRGVWGFDEVNRKNKVAWRYSSSHVLNYDAVTADELQGYLSDRTLREQFREMMPLLKKALLEKRREEASEEDFKRLVASEERKRNGYECSPAVIEDAVLWWKTKVIFSRPLSADDAKAFRMIRQHIRGRAA